MNYLDIIILIPVLWLGYIGFKKGLIIELATLLALIGGIFAAVKFSNFASDVLQDVVESKYLSLVAFCVTFIAVVVFVFMLGKLLEKAIKLTGLGLVNRVTGALFGVLKALAFTGGLFLIIHKFNKQLNFISDNDQEGSALYFPLVNTSKEVLPTLKEIDVSQTINPE
jgi:membrane protein required for colicin V production